MSDNFAQCPNCGTGQDYRFPDSYKGEFFTDGTFCFCGFQDVIVGQTEERIVALIKAMNTHTTHSELCGRMHGFAEQLIKRIEWRYDGLQ